MEIFPYIVVGFVALAIGYLVPYVELCPKQKIKNEEVV